MAEQAVNLEQLAEVIASRVNGATPIRPKLRVIANPKQTIFDSITRDCIIRRVRFLRDRFGLRVLIDQAAFNLPGLTSLEDPELAGLLEKMERARENISLGIPFDDADFFTNTHDVIKHLERGRDGDS